MRGRSFRDGIVLLDEAQNTTPKEMKMFVTRIGDAKVILNGDIRQSDLSSKSGLKTAIDMVRHYEMDIPIIEFEVDDIVRSEMCKNWIINWMDWESRA
jgi:phosphate starvation-inducible PhoH-like protein